MIQVNNLLKWLNGDERVDRVLWFDKEEDIIFLIDVMENKMPIQYNISYIEEMLKLKNITFEQSDKYINILKEEEIPTLYIQYRDKAWDVIKPIVEKEPYVYISKERRKLICVARETPFNLIQIKNMELLTHAGGIICPATPSFYSRPQTVEEVVATVVDRVIDLAGIKQNSFRWGNAQ